jgi:hypothetical protein
MGAESISALGNHFASKEMMSRFAEEVDRSLKESEDRLQRDFSSQIEFNTNEI